MTRLVRAKAGHLNIVPQQVRIFGDLVHRPAKELLLEIETGTPGEIAAHLEILAETLAHHIGREHAFGRFRVMRATCGVNVVIARPPAEFRGINPALDLERGGLWRALDLERAFL